MAGSAFAHAPPKASTGGRGGKKGNGKKAVASGAKEKRGAPTNKTNNATNMTTMTTTTTSKMVVPNKVGAAAAASAQFVDGKTGLPSGAQSNLLAQLAQSLWNFPCAVQLRYSWSTDDTAAIVKAASDAAATAAVARDPAGAAAAASASSARASDDHDRQVENDEQMGAVTVIETPVAAKEGAAATTATMSVAAAAADLCASHERVRSAAILDLLEGGNGGGGEPFNQQRPQHLHPQQHFQQDDEEGMGSGHRCEPWEVAFLAAVPFLNCYCACVILHAYGGDLGALLTSSKEDLHARVPLTVPRGECFSMTGTQPAPHFEMCALTDCSNGYYDNKMFPLHESIKAASMTSMPSCTCSSPRPSSTGLWTSCLSCRTQMLQAKIRRQA